MLIAHAPTAVAARDHLDQTLFVAVIEIVVTGEQVAKIIKGQFLRIA